jgi:hypothetical protein
MNDESKTAPQGATLEDVLYLFALIGMAAVAAVVWFALRPQQPTVTKRPRVLPPDDDPEFLRRLDKRRTERHDDDLSGGSV